MLSHRFENRSREHWNTTGLVTFAGIPDLPSFFAIRTSRLSIYPRCSSVICLILSKEHMLTKVPDIDTWHGIFWTVKGVSLYKILVSFVVCLKGFSDSIVEFDNLKYWASNRQVKIATKIVLCQPFCSCKFHGKGRFILVTLYNWMKTPRLG